MKIYGSGNSCTIEYDKTEEVDFIKSLPEDTQKLIYRGIIDIYDAGYED